MKLFNWALPFISLTYANTDSSSCRCQPHESCWPSSQEWNTLNSSINGNLVAVQPVAAVCHEDGSNSSACQEVTASWKNSAWRAAQPGAVQWENWEALPERNETCYIESTRDIPCGQGQISLYSVLAKSAFDIQETVRFAKEHNLRLVIKNSGHDFLGRSSAPRSLQVFTNGMKDIRIIDDFRPAGAVEGKEEGPAVTIAAGVSLQELYAAVAAKNRAVVAGASYTVGAAGGYI